MEGPAINSSWAVHVYACLSKKRARPSLLSCVKMQRERVSEQTMLCIQEMGECVH
jgi:hypothetical protein